MSIKVAVSDPQEWYAVQTRELFAQAISNIFCAFPLSTFTCVDLEAAASALFNTKLDLQPTLTNLVRAKVLRSRKYSGKTLYEVNY